MSGVESVVEFTLDTSGRATSFSVEDGSYRSGEPSEAMEMGKCIVSFVCHPGGMTDGSRRSERGAKTAGHRPN
jgi:hypothetical protein